MQKILPTNAILIPDHAKLAFKGNIFSVYQWRQTMFDDTTKTFEMLKRPDTVQIILVRDEKILLVDDEQPGRAPRLHMPGGRADEEDESWLVAAQRELREETGLICSDWRLISVEQPLAKIEWFIPLFIAQNVTEELPQQLDPGGEKISLAWEGFGKVRERVLSGKETTLSYMVPLLSRITTVGELLALPAYAGTAVSR
jgi:8-oxo-dGTP pyrophosphatase MutT (NUDIX family)